MKQKATLLLTAFFLLLTAACKNDDPDEGITDNLPEITGYPVVETGQVDHFSNTSQISAPSAGTAFYGQDAEYTGNVPSYTNNGDGTITDNITGLMWEQDFSKVAWSDAASAASAATTGGHTDWRVPTVKELYSLMNYTGNQGTGDPSSSTPPADASPFIDTNYFTFEYPSEANARYIDVQYISSTEYVGVTMIDDDSFFGVNFADGRIKAYNKNRNLSNSEYYTIFVRGNISYGINDLTDNGDGTITDNATGLMWMKVDSGGEQFTGLLSNYTRNDGSLNWEEALDFAENLDYGNHTDWRLPNAKELHSIVDYTRAPDVTNSPAIDPVFTTSEIVNEAGQSDYPFFWTSTSFEPGGDAVIIQFGRSLGYMDLGQGAEFYDVHGAGGQRTDPKTGIPTYGFGPQGDVRRVYNHVRLVRDK